MPIPEEVPIVLAGVLSSQGRLEPELAFAACLAGALVGDALMYAIGYHFGHGLLIKHPKVGKYLGAQSEHKFERALQRHGFKVMFLARFMVGVRGPVYLAAGVLRMPFRRFVLWDLSCATIVVGLFFSLSFFFGEHITSILRDAEKTFTLVLLLVGLGTFLWWYRNRRKTLLDRVTENDTCNEAVAVDTDTERDTNSSEDVA